MNRRSIFIGSKLNFVICVYPLDIQTQNHRIELNFALDKMDSLILKMKGIKAERLTGFVKLIT
jgi:hypothetical protein